MSLRESIRKIIREERNVSPRLLRRISGDDLEQIFINCYYEALKDVVHEKFYYETSRLGRLINRTISYMMDEFHPMLYNTIPEGEMWYDEIHNGLERHYKGRIINLYNNKTPRSDFNY